MNIYTHINKYIYVYITYYVFKNLSMYLLLYRVTQVSGELCQAQWGKGYMRCIRKVEVENK